MKKLTFWKSLFLLFALIVGTSTSLADETSAYTLTCEKVSGKSAYGNYYDVEVDGKTWNAPGNMTLGNYWRIGGTDLSETDRTITGKNAISDAITKVTLNYSGVSNGKSSSITFNSISVTVANDADFNDIIETKTITSPTINDSDGGSLNFTPTTSPWPTGKYYKITINCTTTGSKNCGLNVTSIVFYKETAAKTATTTNINYAGLTNTDLKNGTDAGTLSANVTVTEGGAAVSGAIVKWSSDDEDVATVDENTGVVTLAGVGTATITASYEGDDTYAESSETYELNVTDTRTATVTTIDDAGITNIDLKNGTVAGTLTASVTAGSDPVLGATVTWESSDPTVATITDGGVVTLVKVGTTTITASYAGDGSYAASSDTYELTVTDSRQSTSIDITNWNTLFGTSFNGALTTEEKKQDYSGTINNVTVTYVKASNMYIKDAEIRIYNGSNMKFEAPSGYAIYEISVTGNIGSGKEPTSDVGTFDSSKKKWTGLASEVTILRNSGDSYCKFETATIKLKEAAPVTITAAEYATYCNDTKALDFSETGITAYTATDNGTYVKLNEITSGKVPANTPVVLYKEDADGTAISVPVIASAEIPAGTNNLCVSNGTDVENMFVLAKKNNKVGFYKWAGSTDLSAGKVYLQGQTTSSSRDFLGFDGETTTAIDNVVVKPIDDNAPMFNLAGQRVNKSYKGVVIQNGKKYINK